jgi:carboxypeptidase family protein
MLNKKALLLVYCCLLLSTISPLLYGQATGSFSGTITDKTGSVISGATVRATSEGTAAERDSKTDDSGHYLIPLLGVGTYTIRVESAGFQAVEQRDIRLQVDEHRELDFTLSPASVTSTVEVSATEVAVETTNPTLGQVITSEQVADLPLNGRDFVQLATLTPGTTQETNPSSFFNGGPSSEVSTRGSYSLSVGGSRVSSTDWLLDGNDNNELTAGGIAILPSIDAIQEFKVLTYNYSAEWGTRAGPTVLVSIKSGSNRLHGSVFEFFRNTSLDARSARAATREKFNLNQFGFALGGALEKDKTFFFIDYQAKRQRRGVPFNGFVPTTAMQTGDFTSDLNGNPVTSQILFNPYTTSVTGTGANPVATRDPFKCDGAGAPIVPNGDGSQTGGVPCNKIPSQFIDPVAAAMVQLYPTPNANGNGFNFVNVPVRKLNEGEFDVRIDHNFSSNDSMYGRFSYDQAVSFVPGGSPGFAAPSAFASTQNITNHGRNLALSETHVFSDRTLNQINAGFNRIFNHILSFGDRSCKSANLGIPGANLDSSCPSLGVVPPGLSQSTTDCISCGLNIAQVGGPYWALGDRGFAPFQGGTNVFSISDSFDMIRGNHHIRIGGGIRANQLNVLTNGFQDGFWVFTNGWTSNVAGIPNPSSSTPGAGAFAGGGDNMGDFLLGMTDLALHDQTFFGATTGRRWKMFRPYFQDDWRITKNLTFNIGLAWALVTPVVEAENRQSNFNFNTGTYLVPGQNSDGRVGIQFDKTAFEPRIGIAWQPGGSQKTSIRAGYAIFHDSSWNMGGQGLWQNPPFYDETAGGSFFFPDLCPAPTPSVPSPACSTTGGLSAAGGPNMIISNGFAFATAPPSPGQFQGNVNSQNLDFKQGRVQQFNLNVERQLPGNVVFTVGYAGSRGSHILSSFLNENVSQPTACGTVPGYTLGCGAGFETQKYPFVTVYAIRDNGATRYDSLQAKAETKSVRHGLYALLGYTYARNFDSGLSDGLGSNIGATYWPLPGANKLDWGLSQIQLNHQFTASVLYDLPFGRGKQFGSDWNGAVNHIFGGWSVNVIERVSSGFPLFLIASTNNSGVQFSQNGTNITRPIEIADPHKPGPVPTNSNAGCATTVSQGGLAPDKLGASTVWFNPCAFDNAPFGELSPISRSPLYGPSFVNTDFSLIKRFMIREGTSLDFRAEFFNLFNHPQYFLGGSSGNGLQDVDSFATFGVVNNTVNNPRLVQFALKLQF